MENHHAMKLFYLLKEYQPTMNILKKIYSRINRLLYVIMLLLWLKLIHVGQYFEFILYGILTVSILAFIIQVVLLIYCCIKSSISKYVITLLVVLPSFVIFLFTLALYLAIHQEVSSSIGVTFIISILALVVFILTKRKIIKL